MHAELKHKLSSLLRIDASPESVRGLSRALNDALSAKGRFRNIDKDEIIRLQARVMDLVVVSQDESRSSLRDLLTGILESCSREFLQSLPLDRLLCVTPFREIADLPVADDAKTVSSPNVARLRDFCHEFDWSSERRFPIHQRPERQEAGTIWLHGSLEYRWYFFVERRKAKTWTTATGRDACEQLGGEYASAQKLCDYVRANVTPDTPNYWLWVLLGGAACSRAQEAPEVPFPSYKIRACVGEDVGALFPHMEDAECAEKKYSNAVEVTNYDDPLGVMDSVSSHSIQLTEPSAPVEFILTWP